MAKTTIGKSITVDGEILGEEALLVQGTVRGKIATSQTLKVDPEAQIEAEIHGSNISIAGQVHGNVHASGKVEIISEGRLVGDVKAPRITIADGASFKGSVDMDV